jgi:predicted porin
MRKPLLPLMAALPLTLGVAHAADLPVTLYGFVDVAVGKNAGEPGTHVIDSSGSRLGLKGDQDLGNGMTASFQLEHRFTPQTGEASTPFWKGGAWAGLSAGNLGSIKLGRWWTQAFLKSEFASDPFEMGTVGISYGPVGCGGPGGCVGAFWVNNSVTYENSFDGFSFGAQVAEAAPGGTRPWNVGASYANGGLYLGYGHETTGTNNAKWDHATVNYDFGPIKLITGYGTGTDTLGDKRRNIIVGFRAPMGPGVLIGSYDQHRDADVTTESKTSLGYQYAMTKNLKLFTTVTSDSKAASSKEGYDAGLVYSW